MQSRNLLRSKVAVLQQMPQGYPANAQCKRCGLTLRERNNCNPSSIINNQFHGGAFGFALRGQQADVGWVGELHISNGDGMPDHYGGDEYHNQWLDYKGESVTNNYHTLNDQSQMVFVPGIPPINPNGTAFLTFNINPGATVFCPGAGADFNQPRINTPSLQTFPIYFLNQLSDNYITPGGFYQACNVLKSTAGHRTEEELRAYQDSLMMDSTYLSQVLAAMDTDWVHSIIVDTAIYDFDGNDTISDSEQEVSLLRFFFTKQQLYIAATTDSGFAYSDTALLASFVDTVATGDIGKIKSAEDQLFHYTSGGNRADSVAANYELLTQIITAGVIIPDSLQHLLNEVSFAIDTLQQLLLMADSTQIDSLEELLSVGYAIYDSLALLVQPLDSSALDSLSIVRDSLTEILALRDIMLLETIGETINSIAGDIVPVQSSKTVLDVYRRVFTNDTTMFDSTDRAALYDIAILCPWIGGRAVYQARNMLTRFDTAEVNYDEFCNSDSSELRFEERQYKVKKKSTNKSKLLVYPNPTGSLINISYTGAGDNAWFTVYDIVGREIDKVQLNKGNGIAHLNISTLTDGLYLYKVTNLESEKNKSKIVIAR